MKTIELRSDTCTMPTEEMLYAMAHAQVGNDGFGEDPTVNALEEKAAALLGKEAALFVPSGTMGNLLALMTHGAEGQEIIMEADHHSLTNEFGGVSTIARMVPRTGRGIDGALPIEDIAKLVREPGGSVQTGLVWLENSHNNAGGTYLTLEYIESVCSFSHSKGVPVHMDGARLFNASAASGISAKELVAPVDSVMFCLSKGLGCPIGSMLVGNGAFIHQARHNRKRLGGQMRQAGVLAAAGIVALDTMIDRLQEDHSHAKALADKLQHVPELGVDSSKVQTNIVLLNLNGSLQGKARQLASAMKSENILINVRGKSTIRLVTHKDITTEDIAITISALNHILEGEI